MKDYLVAQLIVQIAVNAIFLISLVISKIGNY